MRRAVAAVLAFLAVFSTASLVGASFITLHTTPINAEANDATNVTISLNFPYQYAGTLAVIVNGTGRPKAATVTNKGYTVSLTFGESVLTIITRIFPEGGGLGTNITVKLGQSVVTSWKVDAGSGDYTGIAMNTIEFLPYNLTASNLTLLLSNGQTFSTILNLQPSKLSQVRVYGCYNATYTLNSVVVKRYSHLLTGLTVKDENTGGAVETFDFSEGSNYVRVFDALGVYTARTYYVAPGSSLTAYLVQYGDGSWYTIYAGGSYINQTLQVLRNIDGAWVLVGGAKFDTTGTTSMFLANGVTYMFRILNSQGVTVLQTTKMATPTQPTITLAGGLEGVNMVLSPDSQVAWLIGPASGYLTANETQDITVSFTSAVTVGEATLTVTGDGVNVTRTVQFNATAGEFSVNVTPALPNQYVYATLTLKLSTGGIVRRTRNFYVLPATQGNNSLLAVAKEAPGQLGLGPVGRLLVATVITLMVAIGAGQVAGGAGATVVAAMAWITFAYLGWVDWRIVMISILAGVGLLVRRGVT